MSTMLPDESPKSTDTSSLSGGTGDQALEVDAARNSLTGGSYTSAGTSAITLEMQGITDATSDSTEYFDVVHTTWGAGSFCDVVGSHLVSPAERYTFYGDASSAAFSPL